MTAADLVAVLVGVVALVAVVVLTVAGISLWRTMRELRLVVDELRAEAVPTVSALRDTVETANQELDRVDSLLESAERITTTVDSASRLTFRALSPPIIKTMSFFAGTRRAGARLRSRRSGELIDTHGRRASTAPLDPATSRRVE
ncbi:MAG: hypothetical protein IH940_12865 [Acidobacteria bacterium]|nr:hypothetical protein [Acidobacteriota bacterium]